MFAKLFAKLGKISFSTDPKRNTTFKVTLHIEGRDEDNKLFAVPDDEYVIGVEPAGSIIFDRHTAKVGPIIVNQQADVEFVSTDGFKEDGTYKIWIDKCDAARGKPLIETEVRVGQAVATTPVVEKITKLSTTAAPTPRVDASTLPDIVVATPVKPTAATPTDTPVLRPRLLTRIGTDPTPEAKPEVVSTPVVPKKKFNPDLWTVILCLCISFLLGIFVGGMLGFPHLTIGSKKSTVIAEQVQPQSIPVSIIVPDTRSESPQAANTSDTQGSPSEKDVQVLANPVSPKLDAQAVAAPSASPAPSQPLPPAPQPVAIPQPDPTPTESRPTRFVRVKY